MTIKYLLRESTANPSTAVFSKNPLCSLQHLLRICPQHMSLVIDDINFIKHISREHPKT